MVATASATTRFLLLISLLQTRIHLRLDPHLLFSRHVGQKRILLNLQRIIFNDKNLAVVLVFLAKHKLYDTIDRTAA